MGRNLGPLNIKDTYEGLVQITSGSIITDGSGSDITYLNITASNADQAGTSGYSVSASWSDQAGTAGFTPTATSASWADQAGTAGFTPTATSASWADQAGTAGFSSTATSASWADQAGTSGFASTATSASHAVQADSASIADDLIPTANISIASISASDATFVSASIGYLQTVTGSAVIIGDSYVIVNSSPTTRYAGIKVYESGAAVPTTASLEFDSVTNDWFYEYTGSDPTNFGAVMFGPEYSTKGSPTYPTANTLVKGNGGHHIIDSSITDDGTDVVVSANISASGFISASTYYGDGSNLSGITTDTGSLLTTASYSDPTLTFTKGDGSTFDITLATGGAGFPFTGSAEISGSLTINRTGLQSTAEAFTMNGGVFKLDTDSYNNAVIVNIGQNNSVAGGSPTVGNLYFVGGNNNTMNATTYGFLWGENSTINSTSFNGVILGTYGGTLTGDYSALIGGQSNQSAAGGTNAGIFAGSGNNISAGGQNNVILGGNTNSITTGNHGFVLGGFNNTVSTNKGWILGAEASATNGGEYSGVVGGKSNTSSHNYSVVLGGQSLSTSKTEEAVVKHLSVYGDTYISSSTLGTGSLIDNLGQEGVATTDSINHIVYCTQTEYDALTPDDNTMYVISGSGDVVDDLIVSGSLIGDVKAISVASSTGSLDCSTGNYFTLGLANAADTRLEASNIQIGQTINIKITNNATAAGTISFGPEFEFEGGTAFTATAATSAVDIITAVSFDGTSLQVVGVKNFS